MEWVVIVTALIGRQNISAPIWKFYPTREACVASVFHFLPLMKPGVMFQCKKGYPI